MCSDFKSKLADRWLSKNRFELAEASLAVGFLQHEYEKGVGVIHGYTIVWTKSRSHSHSPKPKQVIVLTSDPKQR